MPLSEENQQWVLAQIQQSLNPNGWRRFANQLRYWGLTGACVTGVIGLIAIIFTLAIALTNRATLESGFRASTETTLKGIDTHLGNVDAHLKEIDTTLLSIRTSLAAGQPTKKASIAEAKAALATAQKQAIQLPNDVVEQSGVSFIDAAAKVKAAWDAVLAFLNYRSSSITYTRRVEMVKVPDDSKTHYPLIPKVDNKPVPQVSDVQIAVAPKDAARFEFIGHNLNERLQYGPPELEFSGGAMLIDNLYLRHVILAGVEVHYSGMPLMLEDVIFHNCTFVFDNTGPSRDLGKSLLATSPVNFAHAG